jgi:hypothetical protein
MSGKIHAEGMLSANFHSVVPRAHHQGRVSGGGLPVDRNQPVGSSQIRGTGGKIGQRQEGRINFLHQFAILFGLGFHGLPFQIVLEGFPVRGRRLAARMLQNLKERAAFHGLVQRRPVGNTLHSMFRKELIRIVSEAGHEAVQLSGDHVINTQFIDLR